MESRFENLSSVHFSLETDCELKRNEDDNLPLFRIHNSILPFSSTTMRLKHYKEVYTIAEMFVQLFSNIEVFGSN